MSIIKVFTMAQNKYINKSLNLFLFWFTFLPDAFYQQQCLLGFPLTKEKYIIKLENSVWFYYIVID